jgi:FMN reductase
MDFAVLFNAGFPLVAPNDPVRSVDRREELPRRLRIVGIAGSVHRASRSRALLDVLVGKLPAKHQAEVRLHELVDYLPALGATADRDALQGPVAEFVSTIEAADALLVACPVYKGSYPGLFKHLFDLVDANALAGCPVLIAATGGGPRHALVVEHQLRPLFGFFAALTVPTAVYACDGDFRDGRLVTPSVLERAEIAAGQFAALVEARRMATIT